jgi:hypothetical protein
LDNAGNLGLGVTPSTSNLGKNIEIGSIGNSLMGRGANDIALGANVYYNSGFKYAATGLASLYETSAGVHYWYNAPSGTAGNAITFTQAATLDASGNFLVGTTSTSGVTSNTAKVVGGQFKSAASTVATSTTATTMFTMSVIGTYYVTVQYSASNAAAFDAFAIILYDGSSQRIALQSNGTQILITLSGNAVQVTNLFNTATVNWSYMIQSIL